MASVLCTRYPQKPAWGPKCNKCSVNVSGTNEWKCVTQRSAWQDTGDSEPPAEPRLEPPGGYGFSFWQTRSPGPPVLSSQTPSRPGAAGSGPPAGLGRGPGGDLRPRERASSGCGPRACSERAGPGGGGGGGGGGSGRRRRALAGRAELRSPLAAAPGQRRGRAHKLPAAVRRAASSCSRPPAPTGSRTHVARTPTHM